MTIWAYSVNHSNIKLSSWPYHLPWRINSDNKNQRFVVQELVAYTYKHCFSSQKRSYLLLRQQCFLLSQEYGVDNACRKTHISGRILWIIKIWETILFWARWNYNGKYNCNCMGNALGSCVPYISRSLLFACIFTCIMSLDCLWAIR